MRFRAPFLMAMRERVPSVFNQMNRDGTLMPFAEAKVRKAHALFAELTADAPKDPTGYPREPWAREAEEIVLATLIDFTERDDTTAKQDELGALLNQRQTRCMKD